jgi:hypothetical protein
VAKIKFDSDLLLDKLMDLVLMFLGLYAAIAVQDLVDAGKERRQYSQLLQGFSDELKNNKKQRGAVEEKLGALNVPGIGRVKERVDFFKAQSSYYARYVMCYRDLWAAQDPKTRRLTEASDDDLKACGKLMKGGFKEKDPEHLALTPVYRRDVWRFYLAGGVHLFQEFESKHQGARCTLNGVVIKSLAICIGSTYGELDEIEKEVSGLQDLVNDTYFNRQGALAAAFEEFKERVKPYQKARSEESYRAISSLAQRLVAHVDESRVAVDRTAAVMHFKVKLLKERMLLLDARFKEVRGRLRQELGLPSKES